jgi:hypothetical protein
VGEEQVLSGCEAAVSIEFDSSLSAVVHVDCSYLRQIMSTCLSWAAQASRLTRSRTRHCRIVSPCHCVVVSTICAANDDIVCDTG